MNIPRAAFFDVDGTLTNERVWKGFIDYFRNIDRQTFTYYRFIGYHYFLYFLKKAGLLSESKFRGTWALNMAWFLKGYSIEQADPVWEHTVEFVIKHWRVDTRSILNGHQETGDLVVIVSSGPFPMMKRIASELNVTHVVATQLEIKDGKYTGRSIKPACIEIYKASMTQDYLINQGYDVDFVNARAYADSIADQQMLEMTGKPVAVYPEDALKKLAVERKWEIYPEPGGLE